MMTMPVPMDLEMDPRLLYGTGVVEFEGKRFLAVALPSPQPDQRCRIVILPGLSAQSAEDYRELLKLPEPAVPVDARYNFEFGIPEKRLLDPGYVGYLHYLWQRPLK